MSNLAIERRNTLYYNKYQFKAKLKFPFAYLLRTEKNIKQINEYIKIWNPLLEVGLFEKYFKWVEENECDKITVSNYAVFFYSNDLFLLKTTEQHFSKKLKLFKAKVTIENGIKYFCEQPKHNFRVYLKNFVLDKQEFQSMVQFLKTHKTLIFPSDLLNIWITRHSEDFLKYPTKHQSYFHNMSSFIEYDDESTGTLLRLTLPAIFTKTFKLEKDVEGDLHMI